ncbi:hypothetical protein GDO86_013240 [Hymenochirus boettgeri]|uniref:Interferon-induced protein with tetratricopeptide repeats 5 n=1 Tax=Hymenochirus boettgeri TaxID=247094 RepID=A0A8T2IUH6_9PIPI|nr:hypothetical protein GDO86_013240 [Hymenochirus boettgeri]
MPDLTGGPGDESLLTSLGKLECHFTWKLVKEKTDIDDIEERLHDQIVFLPSAQSHRLYNLLAYTSYLKGERTEAIRRLQRAEEHIQQSESFGTDIKKTVTLSNYAWLYYYSNELTNCQSYLKEVEAIYKKSKSCSVHNSLLTEVYGEQAWTLLTFHGRSPEKAKACFEKVLAIDPDNPDLNSGYAIVMYRLESEERYEYGTGQYKSLECLKRAVKLNQSDSVIKALLGLKYQCFGQREEGMQMIEAALKQTPDSPYLLRYVAKFYRREGMIEKAIAVAKKALSQTPTSSSLHYLIGICYSKKVNSLIKSARSAKSSKATDTYTQLIKETISYAIFHFEKAIEIQKRFAIAHIELANMYVKGQHPEKAENTFLKALAIENLKPEDKQEILFQLALYKQYQNKSESEAIEHYKNVLLIPNTTKARMFSKQNLEKMAKNIIQQDPSDATGFALLGFIYQLESDTEQAIEYYKKARERDRDNEEYLNVLCSLQLSINN